ncbi:nuclear transport factor 2 family protein [Mucilaginibacter robiniae]|uniref:Nuclear transport factor 2 family protein n=1 Tax=Mucilaginibacter robiniae TaxID=2728022 RepID=A0A7L5E2L8_9SPHI|nr:nuclear transport factor 2 family protein [Mucilaginibacter robiniae]QJD96677.1 nuclear transport factor 2 family protein [Mucilaginibacter robiniae]
MESQYWPMIKKAYSGFNNRDIDSVFSVMDAHVHWPKAFEGGYVIGYDAVRAYWTRQWSEINPKVEPRSITERPDGKVEVLVDQLVKDLDGNIVFDGTTKHVYSFINNLIVSMDIEAS